MIYMIRIVSENECPRKKRSTFNINEERLASAKVDKDEIRSEEKRTPVKGEEAIIVDRRGFDRRRRGDMRALQEEVQSVISKEKRRRAYRF